MKIDKDIRIICICLLLYFANQFVKRIINIPILSYFLKNYFNDTICGCLIVAYANVVLRAYKRKKYQLNKVLLILLFELMCGVFWEFIIPVFRANRTSDYYDILAYMIGGVVYWTYIWKEE